MFGIALLVILNSTDMPSEERKSTGPCSHSQSTCSGSANEKTCLEEFNETKSCSSGVDNEAFKADVLDLGGDAQKLSSHESEVHDTGATENDGTGNDLDSVRALDSEGRASAVDTENGCIEGRTSTVSDVDVVDQVDVVTENGCVEGRTSSVSDVDTVDVVDQVDVVAENPNSVQKVKKVESKSVIFCVFYD